MTRKRKRLKKLLMAMGIPRNDTDFFIDLNGPFHMTRTEQIKVAEESLRDRHFHAGDF